MAVYAADLTFLGEPAGVLEARPEHGTLLFRPNAWGRRNARAIRRELRFVRRAYRDTETLALPELEVRRLVIGEMREIGDGAA